MLAQIIEGEVDTADVFFLLATILAVLAAILYALGTRVVAHDDHTHRVSSAVWGPVLGWAAVACFAFAWFVL